MNRFEVHSIGEVTQDKEGFTIQLDSKFKAGLKALEGFQYIQVIWWFSECDKPEYRSILTCEQPYKQAPKEMGIFATRSPFRPNPIALSVVQVIQIDEEKGTITVPYIDTFDHTPILDIKPYTPSMDRIEQAGVPAWCSHWPNSYEASGSFDWENEFNF